MLRNEATPCMASVEQATPRAPKVKGWCAARQNFPSTPVSLLVVAASHTGVRGLASTGADRVEHRREPLSIVLNLVVDARLLRMKTMQRYRAQGRRVGGPSG